MNIEKIDFDYLREYCESKYSGPLSNNISLLKSYVWNDVSYTESSFKNKVVRQFLRHYYQDYQYIKSIGVRSSNIEYEKIDLLLTLTNTREGDQPFFTGIINNFDNKINTAIFTRKENLGNSIYKSDYPDVDFILEDDIITRQIIKNAKNNYDDFHLQIQRFGQEFNLNKEQMRETEIFFKKYFTDSKIFRTLLTYTQPSVILAKHYHTHPGYIPAIKEYNNNNKESIESIIIQHGALGKGHTKPHFHGADTAILWGKYFEDTIERYYKYDNLSTEILGNPKLEYMLKNRGQKVGNSQTRNYKILYISTPLIENNYGYRSLELFFQVISELDNVNTICKLHPRENINQYKDLLEKYDIPKSTIAKERDIYDLIAESDLVIGTTSTALMESTAFSTPVIQLFPSLSKTDWGDYGMLTASGPTALKEIIDNLRGNKKYKKRIMESQNKFSSQLFFQPEGANKRIRVFLEDKL
ncbi:hypothetical protein HPS36_03965 [Halorubrum salinarum]|uniref:Uncharacterized protein n=1 Tax=Halorubrum salinarum TaxID=2739057 RepID=A0A7D4D324_9EURY|nr:hypothetical protein [Halorubrum salinarum]QKG92042.1 hypothetical protein HPS36_03965 [Halorubrum salinarum]